MERVVPWPAAALAKAAQRVDLDTQLCRRIFGLQQATLDRLEGKPTWRCPSRRSSLRTDRVTDIPTPECRTTADISRDLSAL